MSEVARNFTLSSNLIHVVTQLSVKSRAELFMHILSFANGEERQTDDIAVNIVFAAIKQDLIIQIEKDKEIKIKRSYAGQISAAAKKLPVKTPVKRALKNSTHVNTCQHMLTHVELPPSPLKLNYQEIIDVFNATCTELQKARLTDDKKKLIDTILKKYTLSDIGLVFQNVSDSDFLSGKVIKWKANFGWILNPNNFIKVLDGNYINVKDPKINTDPILTGLERAINTVQKFYHPNEK